MKRIEPTAPPTPPHSEITPSLEGLLMRDLQAWIAAKEAIQRAISSSMGQLR